MTTTTHTPGPWYTSSRILYAHDPYHDGRDRYIGYCNSKEPDARSAQDSAFIIRACNAHEGLVASLETFVTNHDDLYHDGNGDECTETYHGGRNYDPDATRILAARVALRAAKGEE